MHLYSWHRIITKSIGKRFKGFFKWPNFVPLIKFIFIFSSYNLQFNLIFTLLYSLHSTINESLSFLRCPIIYHFSKKYYIFHLLLYSLFYLILSSLFYFLSHTRLSFHIKSSTTLTLIYLLFISSLHYLWTSHHFLLYLLMKRQHLQPSIS